MPLEGVKVLSVAKASGEAARVSLISGGNGGFCQPRGQPLKIQVKIKTNIKILRKKCFCGGNKNPPLAKKSFFKLKTTHGLSLKFSLFQIPDSRFQILFFRRDLNFIFCFKHIRRFNLLTLANSFHDTSNRLARAILNSLLSTSLPRHTPRSEEH